MYSDHSDYDYLYKFLTLGDSGVGKTSFLYYYCEGTFNNKFISTVGIDFREKRLSYRTNDGRTNFPSTLVRIRAPKLYFRFFFRQSLSLIASNFRSARDTSGQERYRSLTNSFFRGAIGFILMFDITNESSFLNIQNWLEQLRTHGYTDTPNVIIIGNKSDLFDRRVISQEKARSEAQKYGLTYIETSASTGQNVEKAFEILLDLVSANMRVTEDSEFLANRINPSSKIRLQTNIFEKPSCSCYDSYL